MRKVIGESQVRAVADDDAEQVIEVMGYTPDGWPIPSIFAPAAGCSSRLLRRVIFLSVNNAPIVLSEMGKKDQEITRPFAFVWQG